MIKIPGQDRKFSQPNNSDLFGNIRTTKNMNFDEEGYIKLSPRTVSLVDSITDTDFNIPVSYGRELDGVFNIVTTEKPFETIISESNGISAAIDNGTSRPTNTIDSFGSYWQNRWYVTTDTALFYRTVSTGNWTDASVSLTTQKMHPVELFRNRNEFCIGNGNTVIEIDTSHSTTTTLTIPADYEVAGLSYNNNTMAIITKLSDTAAGQNQNAFFFVWDGSTTSADNGYDTGSDLIAAIVPYKSSWVILTRTGNLMYFNGGGFDILASLPIYYLDKTWGDSRNREAIGDVMRVEGDIILINVNNAAERYSPKSQTYVPGAPGGVLCYDPNVGLYHRYSPSISPASRLTVTSANINTTTGVFTKTAGTIYPTGNPIKYIWNPGSVVSGLTVGVVYYVIKMTSTTFRLATTRQNALDGVYITPTAANDAYFLNVNVLDYGASHIGRTGGIGLPELRDNAIAGILFGGECFQATTLNEAQYLNFASAGFHNRGYFTTPKIVSQNVKDTSQKGFIKFRPLKTGDKIIVKHKTRIIDGLPVTTPQYLTGCAWTSSTVLTTTADISEAYNWLNLGNGNELECEIISGAGAGNMIQISTISYNAGTYTVTLAEEVEGGASGNVCNIQIENWKKVCEVSSTTPENAEGYYEFPVGESSAWIEYKVEARGVDVAIYEFQGINETDQNSV